MTIHLKWYKILIGFLALIFLGACSGDTVDPIDTNTLSYYVEQFPDRERDILISCAASEPESNPDFGVSIYFYPFPGATDYRLYESTGVNINPNEYSNYFQVTRNQSPVFNGYLQRYHYPNELAERWIILSYLTEDKIHISDPIRLKQDSKPSLYASDKINIDLTTPSSPLFSWESDDDHENIIYFQVVSDSTGTLISGTYTYDKHWQFYDLSNVVLNIKDQNPPPVLKLNSTYSFTLMGVSDDNWVNLIGEQVFFTISK